MVQQPPRLQVASGPFKHLGPGVQLRLWLWIAVAVFPLNTIFFETLCISILFFLAKFAKSSKQCECQISANIRQCESDGDCSVVLTPRHRGQCPHLEQHGLVPGAWLPGRGFRNCPNCLNVINIQPSPCHMTRGHGSRASNDGYPKVHIREDFTITEKAPTWAFSSLKAPTITTTVLSTRRRP